MIIRPGRLADAHGIAIVHVLSWQTTYKGILPDQYLAALSVSGREREWREHLAHAEGRDLEPFESGFHGWGRRKKSPPQEGMRPIVMVAEEPGTGLVGFAEGGSEREGVDGFDGELNALYLLREWQRLGIGRRIVKAFAEELASRGVRSMIVWVLAENRSRGFYQAMGGEEVTRELELVGTSVHEKVAYGWRRLEPLLAAQPS